MVTTLLGVTGALLTYLLLLALILALFGLAPGED